MKRTLNTLLSAALLCSAMIFATTSCATTSSASKNSEFMGDFDPQELGKGSILKEKVLGNELFPEECTFMLYPKDGTVGMLFKHEFNKNQLRFNKAERTALIAAITTYADDFNNKRLNTKTVKPSDCYGKIQPRIEWGPFQFNGYAFPKVTLSYVFHNNAPYFCINVPMTNSPERKGDITVQYNGVTLYLTLSQCEELVTAFSPETINAVVTAHSIPADNYTADTYQADTYQADTYTE